MPSLYAISKIKPFTDPFGDPFFAKTKMHILFAKVWVSNKSTGGKAGKDHNSPDKGITESEATK